MNDVNEQTLLQYLLVDIAPIIERQRIFMDALKKCMW